MAYIQTQCNYHATSTKFSTKHSIDRLAFRQLSAASLAWSSSTDVSISESHPLQQRKQLLWMHLHSLITNPFYQLSQLYNINLPFIFFDFNRVLPVFKKYRRCFCGGSVTSIWSRPWELTSRIANWRSEPNKSVRKQDEHSCHVVLWLSKYYSALGAKSTAKSGVQKMSVKHFHTCIILHSFARTTMHPIKLKCGKLNFCINLNVCWVDHKMYFRLHIFWTCT